MSQPLDGIKVVEVAEYVFTPAAGVALADWGADVIKISHAHRPDRILSTTSFGVEPGIGGFYQLWEPFNRGKRSIGIDLGSEAGHRVLMDLVSTADVFITSLLPGTRQKLGIDVDHVREANPGIIYACGSAHGPLGDEADAGGFDSSVYWFRSGMGLATTPDDATEPTWLPAPAFGDGQAGIALAAGVCAALVRRERTGEGSVIDVSLLAMGVWAMQASLVGANLMDVEVLPKTSHATARNPISNAYRTKDGRFIVLAIVHTDAGWEALCKALDRPELAADERFATIERRLEHREACIQVLDEIFAARSFDDLSEALAKQEGPWAPAQRVGDLNRDEQVWANGYLQRVDYGDGRALTLAVSPVLFDEEVPVLTPAPRQGQDTESVLRQHGWDPDDIRRLKERGVIA